MKRSPIDAISGTVINVGQTANIVHCFQENGLSPSAEQGNTLRPNLEIGTGTATIRNVPDEELALAVEWEEGAFVIWKNCWLGMIEKVEHNVSVRLSNGSVVIPEDCSSLEVPIGTPSDAPCSGQNAPNRPRIVPSRPRQPATPTAPATPTTADHPNVQTTRISAVPAPPMLTVGQQIITKKGNLRKGKWIYGAYDASILPIGTVVDVQVSYLGVNWCCQNIAVEEFVAVPSPPSWLEAQDLENLRKYKTSTRGLRTPATGFGVANLAVGDKVRFKDLDEAVSKYDGRCVRQGRVYKIPRIETLGFDVNTFMVELTTTWVEVQWQDLTTTKHLAKELTQYPNVDEHELWPGEVVIVKNDIGEDLSTSTPPPRVAPSNTGNQISNDQSESTAEVIVPKAVGVVQTVDAQERVAKVRWFETPQMELAGTFLVPGSRTGKLKEEVEEVSFYEVVAHQALGMRRGDFVILLPESRPIQPVQTGSEHLGSPEPEPPGTIVEQMARQFGFFRNMMAASPSATLQSISNFISETVHGEQSGRRADESENLDFMSGPTDWFGEIVDLGLDGLVTVRLGVLDEPKDVKLPIERLTVIFSEPSDIDGWVSEDGSSDEDYDSEEDENDIWDDPMVEETVIYEGGERIHDDGGDEAWLTDPEDMGVPAEMDVDVRPLEPPDVIERHDEVMSDPAEEDFITPSMTTQAATTRLPTKVHPEPEAFTIPAGAEKPPGFAILEDGIPSEHAFASTSPTQMDAAFLRRVAKEHNILQTSLPEGILVRTWESRLDLLRVLIIGPLNTPYELAPFVFDFHLGADFPTGPPSGHFHSWTGGVGRVNPNLYEEGKICLSLLGTWHAQSYSEGWTVGSSVLQLLVSLMGLVLVKEPYYSKSLTTNYLLSSGSWGLGFT